MYQIPGPNPIITPSSGDEAWDSTECETSGGVYKFDDTYYYSYHCNAGDGYQMGVATAKHPLGPWTKSPHNPVLKTGDPSGKHPEWDSWVVASGNILPDPEKPGKFLMFYEGGRKQDHGTVYWSVGLAHADSPAGPWTKNKNNPIIRGELACDKALPCPSGCCGWPDCAGFYVGSVMRGVHTGGEFWLYAEAPVGLCCDQGPMALWASKSAEGPFALRSYVLQDRAGFSESKVAYANGLFHLFATGLYDSASTGNRTGTSTRNNTPLKKKPAAGQASRRRTRGYRARVNSRHRPEMLEGGGDLGLGGTEPEQLGYAVSRDGTNFTFSRHNPVGTTAASTVWSSAMAEGHVHFGEDDGHAYVFHTTRYSPGPSVRRNAEDLGVDVFALSKHFTLEHVPLLHHLAVGPGGTSACEYDAAAGAYCPQLKVRIGGTDIPPSDETLARVTLAFSCKCPESGAVDAKMLVDISEDPKQPWRPAPHAAASKVSGKCAAGDTFMFTTPTRSYNALWIQVRVHNAGNEVLKEVAVTGTLVGGDKALPIPPTPAPAPTPNPYDPNCKLPPSKRASCCGQCDPSWHCETCQTNPVDNTACITCEDGYVHDMSSEPDCTGPCSKASEG